MRVAVKKMQVEDAAKLQMLVAENIDAIEPGLVVLDSRLLLGHATIDVVGLDASGKLVLIATGLTANEAMLLKAVEAYSWCREYPESLARLYPSCVISDERPPRLLFVAERMPDAFHRKIKQLGFPEVDCVEFRLLDVDGVPAVCFDSILRLHRTAATAPAPQAEAPAAPAAEPEATGGENVIAMNGAVAARATSLKLQKLLNQAVADGPVSAPRASERPALTREPAPVVSMLRRQAATSPSRHERPRPEPVTLRQPDASSAVASAVVLDPEPVTAPGPATRETAATVATVPTVVPGPEPVLVPDPIVIAPEPTITTPDPVVVAPAPVIVTPEPVVLPHASLPVTEPERATERRQEPATSGVVPAATPTPEPLAIEAAPVAIETEPGAPAIPALPDGRTISIPNIGGDSISLRDLPGLSLRPSVPAAAPSPAPGRAVDGPGAEAVVSFKDLAASLLGPIPAPVVATVQEAASAAVADKPVTEAPVTPAPLALESTPKLELVTSTPAADVIQPPAPAKVAEAVAEVEPALTVEALIKTAAPEAAPAVAPAAPAKPAVPAAKPSSPAAAAAARPAPAPVPEFEGLKFPNDGVLTRQWMEFLSQMSSAK